MNIQTKLLSSTILLSACAFNAQAGLGKGLTDTGATAAGNDKGVAAHKGVSRWEKNMPKGYKSGAIYPAPFKKDKAVLTITQKNMAKYDDMLSEGHKALMAKYPSYKMNIYPSHRPADYHPKIDKATAKNAKTGKLKGTDGVSGVKLGFAFPIPEKNGKKVIWNHKVRYRGDSVIRANDQIIVDGKSQSLTKVVEKVLFTYGNIKYKKLKKNVRNNMSFYYLSETTFPAKLSGSYILVYESLNQIKKARKAFIANKGDAKMKSAPTVGYNKPNDTSGGLSFSDQVDMYNGAMDRYSWKYVDKKTMYIPYNAYKLGDKKLKYKEILGQDHVNPKYTRYEPHRVWIVDSDNSGKAKHDIKRRVFYVDEDSWGIVMVDVYDQADRLWKFQEGHTITAYDVGVTTTTPEIIYDFVAGKYFATALTNEGDPNKFNKKTKLKHRDFKKSAVERQLR